VIRKLQWSCEFVRVEAGNANLGKSRGGTTGVASTSQNESQRPSPFARPLPQGVSDHGNRYTLAQRIQCLTLLSEGFPPAHIEQRTGVKERSQRNIRKKAFDRGFRPDEDPRILESYVVDSDRPGRPKKASTE
jgi:hypothetical protein